MGVVSAFGPDLYHFERGLQQGRCAIRPMESVDATLFRFQNGAEVSGFDPSEHFDEKQLAYLDRFAQFALVAAREAASSSGIQSFGERTAVVTGSCVGGQSTLDDAFLDMYGKKLQRFSPLLIARIMSNAGASQIAMEYGITGPAYSVSTACSSGSHALGQAMHMVRSGAVDQAIAGGCESVFSFGFLKSWEAMRVVSTDTCRPFSKDRKGLILGEGAAMLVLETLEAAKSRGATIYAGLCGFGMSSDAHHLTQPSAEGAARTMQFALEDAAVHRDAVGYINAHGTGTPANDPTEISAIRQVFGRHADTLAVSSTKSMHGHALGAAGALEAVATVLALRNGILPPTANYTVPDPECDLDVIPNEPRRRQVEYALSNSFAFGGLNAVLAFRAPAGL